MELPKFGEVGELLVTKTAPLVITGRLIDTQRQHVGRYGLDIIFEEERTGLLVSRETSLEEIADEYKLDCVFGETWTRFKAPVLKGDAVEIQTDAYLRSLQLTFYQTMRKQEEILAEQIVTNFFVNPKSKRLAKIPAKLISIFSTPEESLPEDRRNMTGPNTFPYPLPK